MVVAENIGTVSRTWGCQSAEDDVNNIIARVTYEGLASNFCVIKYNKFAKSSAQTYFILLYKLLYIYFLNGKTANCFLYVVKKKMLIHVRIYKCVK